MPSSWLTLDKPGDDREQGSKDYYRLEWSDPIGDIAALELQVKKADADSPNWLLDTVWVCRVDDGRLLKFPYKRWINPTSKTEWITIRLEPPHDLGEVALDPYGRNPFLWGVPTPKFTAKYTIRLDTPKVAGAGTNADVHARILTTKGPSAWRVLDLPNYDDREQGTKDYYKLYFEDWLGDISGLELRVKKADEDSPSWLLQTAWVCKVSLGRIYEMPYGRWIKPTSYSDWVYAKLDNLIQHPDSSPFIW
jgi:hypothetical protein